MKKQTNFDIVNYVHLSYAGALSDRGLKGGGSESLTKKRYKSIYERLESSFVNEVGISSEEFVNSLKKSQEALESIYEMFRCKTMDEIKNLVSEERLKQLSIGDKAISELISIGKTQGYAELLGQLYSEKSSNDIKKLVEDIAKSFEGVDFYKDTLKYLSKGKSSSANKEKQAMSIALINQILSESKTIKQNSGTNTIFTGEFSWQEPVFDTLNKNLEDFSNAMSKGIPIKNDEINKIIKANKAIIDRNIKGAILGEYSSGIITKGLIEPILTEVVNATNTEIKHTGTSSGKTSSIDISIDKLYKNKKSKTVKQMDNILNGIVKGVQTFTAKDRKADITVTYDTPDTLQRNLKISTKRYKTSAYAVNIADKISIGAALSFGKYGNELANYYTGNSKTGSQFYNALNFYLLNGSYTVKKEKDIAKVVKESSRSLTVSTIDAAFGGILSKFLIDILANMLEPESSAFIDINGMIIPTPLYYKFMMDRFFNSDIKNSISSYISFNANSFTNKMEKEILKEDVTGARKLTVQGSVSWKTGYFYDIAARKRNLLIKDGILNHQISLRSNFLEVEQYRNKILNIK